jgi:peroxiredoxin
MPAASAEAARPLPVGADAPTPALQTAAAQDFSLAAAFAQKPTVLIFYRGSWCPYCNRHLAALAGVEPQLLALGYQILAVSPDTAAGLKAMAEKNHLNYALLSDRSMNASAAYGVAFRVPPETEKSYRANGIDLAPAPDGRGAWLPVPAVFIIDRQGRIRCGRPETRLGKNVAASVSEGGSLPFAHLRRNGQLTAAGVARSARHGHAAAQRSRSRASRATA